jgi:hypothetical protein
MESIGFVPVQHNRTGQHWLCYALEYLCVVRCLLFTIKENHQIRTKSGRCPIFEAYSPLAFLPCFESHLEVSSLSRFTQC